MGGLLSGCQDGPPLSLWCRHAQSFPPPSPTQPSPAQPGQLSFLSVLIPALPFLNCLVPQIHHLPLPVRPSVRANLLLNLNLPASHPPPPPHPRVCCVSVQEREAEETKKSNCLLAPNSPRRSLQPGCLHPHPGGGRRGERGGGGGGEDAGKAENWEVRVEGGHWG